MRKKSSAKKSWRRIDRHPAFRFLEGLWRNNVPYVIIGVTGLNYYALSPGRVYGTQDIDVFVKPDSDALRDAYRAAVNAGLDISHQGKPVTSMKKMVKIAGSTTPVVLSSSLIYLTIDLIQSVTGMSFEDLYRGHSVFRTDGIPVRVAAREKIIGSKILAGREKDEAFLKIYRAGIRRKSR